MEHVMTRPKEPTDSGWIENSIAAERVVRATEGDGLSCVARSFDHGPLRVVSSCQEVHNIQSWIVSVSRYNRKPPDYVIEMVRGAFGMEAAVEVDAGNKLCRVLVLGMPPGALPLVMIHDSE
jgi:hypothetical protein